MSSPLIFDMVENDSVCSFSCRDFKKVKILARKFLSISCKLPCKKNFGKPKINQNKQKFMTFWIVFDIWAKQKKANKIKVVKIGPFYTKKWAILILPNQRKFKLSYHAEKWTDFHNFVLFASFLPESQKRFKTSLIFVCFDWFSEILLTSHILKLWRQLTTLHFRKKNEQVESFVSILIIFDVHRYWIIRKWIRYCKSKIW